MAERSRGDTVSYKRDSINKIYKGFICYEQKSSYNENVYYSTSFMHKMNQDYKNGYTYGIGTKKLKSISMLLIEKDIFKTFKLLY
jgi:hypothetical protein